jgi:hypothetical protein
MVTKIGNSAFSNCDALAILVVGENVKEIGFCAFEKCRKLVDIEFKNTTGWYVTTIPGNLSGDPIPESDFAKPTRIASYLNNVYDNFYWYRA